jgi:AraC family transcriptional regulator, ethanolamine operon transcriptional activator
VKITDPSASIAQAAVTVDEISEPTAVGAGLELIDQDAVQLQSMPLRARRVIVSLEDAEVIFHSTNRQVRTRTSVREGRVAWVAFGPRARGTVNGLSVRPGLLLAAEPGADVGFVADAGWESITFLLPAEEVGAHLAARGRETEFQLPRGVEILRAEPERCRKLFAWGKRLTESAARQPARFDQGRPERVAARADLLENLLATLSMAEDLELSRSDRTRRAQDLIVKKAEDFASSEAGERIHVGDLCRVAGVSERSLEYAFKEILDTTPMAYLIRLRLHRVRRALLAPSRGSTTVSAEALGFGFWHFGEFSRAYRKCFGELPSETLRRKPEPPGGRR